MSEVVKCDWCDKIGNRDDPSWYGLERGTSSFSDSWPKHFCDALCLEAFANQQQGPASDPRPKEDKA